jgi:hypothetical protein
VVANPGDPALGVAPSRAWERRKSGADQALAASIVDQLLRRRKALLKVNTVDLEQEVAKPAVERLLGGPEPGECRLQIVPRCRRLACRRRELVESTRPLC